MIFSTRTATYRAIIAVMAALAGGCGSKPTERIEWIAMGTIAAVQTRGLEIEETKRIASSVKETLSNVEKLLNARDATSQLRRLETLPDNEILERCDKEMRPCYEAAFAFAAESANAFNPRWRGANTLDLGAIAKGFAVDLAAEKIKRNIRGDVLIDLGGNLKAVHGDWKTSIAGSDAVFLLREGFACATSAEYFRGKHIRHGATGALPDESVCSATVISSSAMWADATSTLAFILGPDRMEKSQTKRIDGSTIWIMKDGRRITRDAGL